jgi:predicted aspartyl protease
MGTFHISCKIENHRNRTRAARIPKLLVDTGSEHTWVPTAALEKIGVAREKKDVRFIAILRVGRNFTIDEVVFAEPGDLALLGARTLEGLNLTVDSARRRLVAAGPVPAA